MPVSHMRPSMGVIRRPLSRAAAAATNGCSRNFQTSAPRLDNQSGSGSAASQNEPPSRRVRHVNAGRAINSLPNQRAPPMAPRTAPSGSPIPNGKLLTPRKPLVSRLSLNRPAQQEGNDTNSKRPPGPMVRAPSQLRTQRTTGRSPPRGPNKRTGPSRSEGKAVGPKPRKGNPKSDNDPARTGGGVRSAEERVTDGMLQHLLRLQRKEWDKTPYEPKYAPGSFAANELIHAGRELFRGESPDVKIWGRLEQRIGVVGMHGAHGTLKVRRVVDPYDTMLDEYDPPEEVVAEEKDVTKQKDKVTMKTAVAEKN